jgi:hypothetical protein
MEEKPTDPLKCHPESVEKPHRLSPIDVILRPVALQTRRRKPLQAEGSITAAARELVI